MTNTDIITRLRTISVRPTSEQINTLITELQIEAFDPASYRAYRQEWKAAYKALSAEIRHLKTVVKNFMRSGFNTGSEQNKLRDLQTKATTMLAELAEAKEIAKTAWTARSKAAA